MQCPNITATAGTRTTSVTGFLQIFNFRMCVPNHARIYWTGSGNAEPEKSERLLLQCYRTGGHVEPRPRFGGRPHAPPRQGGRVAHRSLEAGNRKIVSVHPEATFRRARGDGPAPATADARTVAAVIVKQNRCRRLPHVPPGTVVRDARRNVRPHPIRQTAMDRPNPGSAFRDSERHARHGPDFCTMRPSAASVTHPHRLVRTTQNPSGTASAAMRPSSVATKNHPRGPSP